MAATLPNTLATRCSPSLAALWTPTHKAVLERRFWLEMLRAQSEAGLPVPARVLDDYERVLHDVDLASIDRRERHTLHDVKARIEEFNALAGHEHVHKGMTGRDLDDNVEQFQIRQSLLLLRARAEAIATAITHHTAGIPADTPAGSSADTPAGSPAATTAHAHAVARLDAFLDRYPLRGIKGPVGTTQDLLHLVDGDPAKSAAVERRMARHLGFPHILASVGQVYPRSLDHDALTALVQLAAAPTRLARTPDVPELALLLRGYAHMTAQLAGDQWNEGDVSCSVVRRVALPNAFFACDALITAFVTETPPPD